MSKKTKKKKQKELADLEATIAAIEKDIKAMEADGKAGTKEFNEKIESLNKLKDSRKKDTDEKLAVKDSKRKTRGQITDHVIKAAEVVGGVGAALVIYAFDSTGNCTTSKHANRLQDMVTKKFLN